MAASLVLLCPDPSAKSPRGPRKQTGSPGLLPQGPRDVFRAAAQVKSPPGGPLSSHTRLSSMEVPLPIFGLVCKFYTAGVPPTRASMSMHSRTLRCHSCPPPHDITRPTVSSRCRDVRKFPGKTISSLFSCVSECPSMTQNARVFF